LVLVLLLLLLLLLAGPAAAYPGQSVRRRMNRTSPFRHMRVWISVCVWHVCDLWFIYLCVRGTAQGVHHVFVAGASTFSFDAVPKFMRPMSTIHHPHVPGFWMHLQRGMNRLFAVPAPANMGVSA
jgi:hypothetical protein